jgi:hypothetical protein
VHPRFRRFPRVFLERWLDLKRLNGQAKAEEVGDPVPELISLRLPLKTLGRAVLVENLLLRTPYKFKQACPWEHKPKLSSSEPYVVPIRTSIIAQNLMVQPFAKHRGFLAFLPAVSGAFIEVSDPCGQILSKNLYMYSREIKVFKTGLTKYM